ncbi:MAG TPA: AsnC family transcriptional regulator [Solirubrobacteraceae bacterium]|nr:AsnC family transcriptional regulator [Solirubrobacteraceae bacterium]
MPPFASDSFTLDRIDNQLLHALLIDGRAPFSLIGQVIGTSEQTIARRYRRLHEAGAVRVLVLPSPIDEGLDWIVRIGVRPGAAARLAGALAARNDVSWLRIMAGGAEILCISRPSSLAERDALLLERLARTNLVTTVAAHAIMKVFGGSGIRDWSAFDDPLDAAQVAALRPAVSLQSNRTTDTRPEDAALLAALREDGRAGYAQLATAARISPARARRRLDTLRASGHAYVHTDVATELLGFPTAASLWLSVAPGDLERVGAQLAALAQTTFVAAVSGPANLTASLVCRSETELYSLLTDEVGAIDAVRAAEVSPVIRRIKQAGTILSGTRLSL